MCGEAGAEPEDGRGNFFYCRCRKNCGRRERSFSSLTLFDPNYFQLQTPPHPTPTMPLGQEYGFLRLSGTFTSIVFVAISR